MSMYILKTGLGQRPSQLIRVLTMPCSLSIRPQNIRCMKQTEHLARTRTWVQETEDDNMSLTHSSSIVQTDYKVLKANCYVVHSFY